MNSTTIDTAEHSAAPSAAVVDDPLEVARFTRWESPKVAGGTPTLQGEGAAEQAVQGVSSLQISGMYCAACAGIIEASLHGVPGVLAASVNSASRRATVRWDPQRTRPSALLAAVKAAGYGATPDAAAPARELRRAESRSTLWRLFVASFCAMQVMMLATPSYVAGAGELASDLRQLLNWGSWLLAVPVLWFAGMPFLRGAWHSVRARRIGMDVPVALGILVTFVASTGATFDPDGAFGHEVYFDSMTMFIAFLWLGRWLEMRARHATSVALEETLSAMPATALRIGPDGRAHEVSVARLAVGDCVRVPAGASIPADGELLTAAAGVSEALLTGESLAVAKRAGDALLAGSINQTQALEMRVQRVGADTRYEAIVALMREALSQRPMAARVADRWAGPFLWGVLLLAAASAAVWSLIDPSRALWVAVAVLIVTCPCALSLATPATLVAAAGGLARRGVLLRRLDALERLAQVQQVFLDKTGTLTQGVARLESVVVLGKGSANMSEGAALALAAGLARWSTHPLSAALVGAHDGAGHDDWHAVQETAGAGLEALDVRGVPWRLGSAAWAGAQGDVQAVRPSDAEAGPDAGAAADSTADDARGSVWLARAGIPVARFAFGEALHPEAASTVAALRSQGLGVTLLSGDQAGRAQALARALTITAVVAGASPEDKLATLRRAQAAGQRVAMVGDGLNDAPVLAAADVSLAMGHGALVAQHSADAVIVSGRPSGVVDALRTARRSMGIVRQNLGWAVVYNLACIPLAMAGWLPPWAAGLGMAASSLLVVLNAQRAASQASN